MAEAKTLGAPLRAGPPGRRDRRACRCPTSPPAASPRPPTPRCAWRSAPRRCSSAAASSCPAIRRAARAPSSTRPRTGRTPRSWPRSAGASAPRCAASRSAVLADGRAHGGAGLVMACGRRAGAAGRVRRPRARARARSASPRPRCGTRAISKRPAGLVLPGGESTAQLRLLERHGLRGALEALRRFRPPRARHLRRPDPRRAPGQTGGRERRWPRRGFREGPQVESDSPFAVFRAHKRWHRRV